MASAHGAPPAELMHHRIATTAAVGKEPLHKTTSAEPPATILEEAENPELGSPLEAPATAPVVPDPNRNRFSGLFESSGQGGHKKYAYNSRRKSTDFSAAGQQTKDRRGQYTRAQSYRNFSASDNKGGGHKNGEAIKTRSVSINLHEEGGVSVVSAADKQRRCRRSTSNGKLRLGSSMTSNGEEGFDYDDDEELDEPFTDSDDDGEHERRVQKPCLTIPKGRIRTLSGTVPPVGASPRWGGPTMCVSCLQFFNLPEMLADFKTHLLDAHHIVIDEVDLIVDPKRYVEHWRQKFAKKSIDTVFPKVTPAEGDPLFGKVDYYFEMSERIPDDYSLRQRLAMRRLEEALQCQQREREDSTFTMQCIFCRYIARGNRSKIIHHLYMIHHLNLGSPDNLVFVAEYVDHLKEKLLRNECIYCETTFADRTVLMDHMRKRNHREVNPKNNYYDKFYIINYLELGKRWLDVLAEDFEDTMPTFADSDDEEEEESWHEWHEENTAEEDQLRAVCLYCDHSEERVEPLLEHMKKQHSLDLLDFFEREKCDFYERMQFLNFVRKQSFNTPNFRARCGSNPPETRTAALPERDEWCTEESLVPMFGNDHLLWMLESHLEQAKSGGDKERLLAADDPAAACKGGEPAAVAEAFVAWSQRNTVPEVEVEEWPDLAGSVLAEGDLYKSMR